MAKLVQGCISFVSYIKPQHVTLVILGLKSCISFVSYIKPQLCASPIISVHGCISFVSYIKPQLTPLSKMSTISCISFVSYIKPQLTDGKGHIRPVVYRSFPTSNHNCKYFVLCAILVVYRSFPTSNHNVYANLSITMTLYIVRFLHQTTTRTLCNLYVLLLYIVRFLHQTTTVYRGLSSRQCCISFVSYIKPQP